MYGYGYVLLELESLRRVYHRRFIYKGDTSTQAEGTDPRGGLSKRARARRHYGPLCSMLVAAKSGGICIAFTQGLYRCSIEPVREVHPVLDLPEQ